MTWTKATRTAYGFDSDTRDQVWRQNANCSPAVAEWFWLVPGRARRHEPVHLSVDNRAALQLCRTCPVLADCHSYEKTNPDLHPRIAAGRLWPEGKVL